MMPNTPSEPIISWRRSGPAADSGARPRSSTPGRCHRAQPADHVVEPAVTRRVLARRSGRGEAADRGELEALREVAEREAAFAEQAFGLRPGDAGAQFGLAGDLVERVQLVEAPQVQRYHGLELAAHGIEPADHAGAAAERDDGDAALRAEAQDLGDLVFVAGQQHRVGRVLDTGILASQQVKGGLAAGTQQPGAVVDDAVLGADDRGEGVAVGRRQRRRPQLTCSGSSSAVGESSTPSACSSRVRIPSDSGLAASGSPHAFHFIGGRSADCCSSGRVMRYSITDAVNQ